MESAPRHDPAPAPFGSSVPASHASTAAALAPAPHFIERQPQAPEPKPFEPAPAGPFLVPAISASAEPFNELAPIKAAEAAPAAVPEAAPSAAAAQALAAPSIESVRHAVGMALVNEGHESAAQLLGSGDWTLDGSSLRIEVPGMGKKMLALTINAAAEKIIRQELQRLGASSRFLVVPGSGPASTGPAITAAPLAGSVQEAALNHPLVQRAKEIFNAEVRSVVDLRQK